MNAAPASLGDGAGESGPTVVVVGVVVDVVVVVLDVLLAMLAALAFDAFGRDRDVSDVHATSSSAPARATTARDISST